MQDKTTLLTPMNNKTIVDRIIARLTRTILSGALKPGDKIPTEVELSESLGVGRNTVREAVKALVAMGVLNIRRAEGTFVADGFSERMLEPMIYGMVLEGGDTPAVSELRYLFESGLLSLAIDKATAEDTERLRAALQTLSDAAKPPYRISEILDADMRFHRQIEQIVGNPLVEKIMLVIQRISQPSLERAIQRFIDGAKMPQMLSMHRRICEIIESKDKASVGEAMDEHFKYWREALLRKEEES